jgi:hypothetical protein
MLGVQIRLVVSLGRKEMKNEFESAERAENTGWDA